MKISPLPHKIGIGFCAFEPLSLLAAHGYRYEQVGRFHNYFVTEDNMDWGQSLLELFPTTIDGFSPNLNKELHVGHLRNLAIANSLKAMLGNNANPVALLGASLGVKKAALDGWKKWTNFLDYHPAVYHDITLPNDVLDNLTVETELGSENCGVSFWNGPTGPVPVIRSDKRPLYAYYDLIFAKEVAPDYYITGHEQKPHFASLGLGDKHLPMGLILGEDGKKMKSRDGEAYLADMAMDDVRKMVGEVDDPDKLAWNILAWNLLRVTREKDVKFDPNDWVRPEAHGMYVSYTYARIFSALELEPTKYLRFMNKADFQQSDIELIGLSNQYVHYFNDAIKRLDPSPIANFSFELARALNLAYNQEKIYRGRKGFVKAVSHACWALGECMKYLGMFLIGKI